VTFNLYSLCDLAKSLHSVISHAGESAEAREVRIAIEPLLKLKKEEEQIVKISDGHCFCIFHLNVYVVRT
jgi:hypothetical protein